LGPVSRFVIRRLLIGILTVWFISIISFIIIQLPPGDFVSAYIAQLSQAGAVGSNDVTEQLREAYGLNRPIYIRYFLWVVQVLHGQLGWSLSWGRPVLGLITERLGLTLILSVSALVLSWLIALPIGIYCAVKRGSMADYILSALGLIGVAIPNFLLALIAMYLAFRYFDIDLGQTQSARFAGQPGSIAKTLDLFAHLSVPIFILAVANTARLMRTMRANLIDELGKPYVVTARGKGMREIALVLKYPVRIALNPFVSTIGMTLPQLISGSVIISIVLNLPTIGPLLLRALQAQDMFLASAILLILAALTVIGSLLSDLLLAWIDPRIQMRS
jgi:peptide/nickel transport system permease protein